MTASTLLLAAASLLASAAGRRPAARARACARRRKRAASRRCAPQAALPRQRRGQPPPQSDPGHVPRRLSLCRPARRLCQRRLFRRRAQPPPRHDLAALRAIDRNALNATDRIAYDVFKYQREDDLRRCQPDMLALTAVRPINHFSRLPHLLSGASPRATARRRSATSRIMTTISRATASSSTLLDRAIARFREGLASGVVETKLTIRNVIDQLDTQLRDAPEASPYYAPVLNFPDAVPEADRARLRAAYLAVDPRRDLSRPIGASGFPAERLSAPCPRRRRPRLDARRRPHVCRA